MKFTSVVGYHMNPLGCGVAKFNAELAKRLGVPFVGLDDDKGAYPLLSLKWSEVAEPWRVADRFWIERPYAVFWHDAGIDWLTESAAQVFYADPSLGSPDLWCPSLLPSPPQRKVKLFSFGMGHKLQPQYYGRVRELLNMAGQDYTLRVSVGVHEGTTLADVWPNVETIKRYMDAEKVTLVGCLSDEALAGELAEADWVLAFFESGARKNNTTIFAALDAGARVLTNCDDRTAPGLRTYVSDISQMHAWPSAPRVYYNWDNLIEALKGCEKSTSRIA
jgi:hypothetical protein